MSKDSQPEKYVLTIRLIRSFECRNLRPLVVKISDLNMLVRDFKKFVNEEVKKATNIPPPFRNYAYDTFKIEHFPFKSKSSDPVINCLDDENLILAEEDRPLSDYNIINETEISYFKLAEYLDYKESKGH